MLGFIIMGLLVVMVVVGVCMIVFMMGRLRKSDYHTLPSMLYQFLVQWTLYIIGVYMHFSLQRDTKNCKDVQEKLLLKILKQNRNTLFGKEHKFSEIKAREQFVKMLPLTKYEYYESYVTKISKGEKKVLTGKMPFLLAVTSGTSGKCKLLPVIKDISKTFFRYGISVLSYCMVTAFPEVFQLQKVLKFFYTPKQRRSEGGIPIGPNSSSPKNSPMVMPLYTTPMIAYSIFTEPEVQYVHLLFALKDRNLGMIEANFASMVYQAFRALHHQWQNLVEDIRFGRLNENLPIMGSIRVEINEILKPDPKRAKELEEEFMTGFEGIAKRIWPHLNLILATDTGSFKFYGRKLKTFYTKGVSHYSPLYAATEGLIGINIWPLNFHSIYLLVPNSMFFEFIPIHESDQNHPRTLFAEQVKEGEIYELVITNSSGLVRYRLGDVIRVVRFHNQTPAVEFLYRQGQLLNVHGEKMTEHVFYEALLDAVSKWEGKILNDYCCAENSLLENITDSESDTVSPHYLIFLEFEDGKNLSEKEKQELDDILRQRHWVYESFRSKGSISACQVFCVPTGTFQILRDFILETTDSSPNQVKIPRVLHNEDALKLLVNQSKSISE